MAPMEHYFFTFIGKLVCHNSVLTYNFLIIEFGLLLFLVVQLIQILQCLIIL